MYLIFKTISGLEKNKQKDKKNIKKSAKIIKK